MNESEQRLTDEFAKLAEQYAKDQRRLQGQVNDLAGQVEALAKQYERERQAHIELTSILGEHIEHVGKLTANYKALTDDLTELWE